MQVAKLYIVTVVHFNFAIYILFADFSGLVGGIQEMGKTKKIRG